MLNLTTLWRMNGNIVVNSSSTTTSHQLLDATINKYTNILTVTGDHHTQTISCEADFVSEPFYNDELKPLTIAGLVKYIEMTITLHSVLYSQYYYYCLQLPVAHQSVYIYRRHLFIPHPVS